MSDDPEIERLMGAMEVAWALIANVDYGNWDQQMDGWREAAIRWRDEHWHAALDRHGYQTRMMEKPL